MRSSTPTLLAAGVAILMATGSAAQAAPLFVPGNLVVSVEGNGVQGASSGPYTDNQAAPLALFQFAHTGTSSATYVNALVLPQTASGANRPVSGEYGSSSEAQLSRSSDGRYLTVMGYGVNAAAFNANPAAYGTAVNDPAKPTALGQSGSLTGQSYVAVPRVAALVDANGNVDSSTALFNVFNGNNPRSAATVDGKTIYVSGQGIGGDTTGGVWVAQRGAAAATAVTGLDTSGKTAAQDTRIVQVVNGQLFVSVDSKQGSGANRDFIGTLGAPGGLPAGLANDGNGPAQLDGFGNSGGTGKIALTAATSNGVNAAGQTVNLSPEGFFFANAATLYVADSGSPKNKSAASGLGAGGLQKWVNAAADGSGAWSLAYTLSDGLGLVANTAAHGTTGLLGLAGKVVGDEVELYATNYTVGDMDPTFLYGITDVVQALTKPSAQFVQLAAAPVDSNFKGVAFAPEDAPADVPEPASLMLLMSGLLALTMVLRNDA